jgi:hypothetical protein
VALDKPGHKNLDNFKGNQDKEDRHRAFNQPTVKILGSQKRKLLKQVVK